MKRFQFLTGFLCGALLFCGLTSGASAASGIIAKLSSQPVYVNGQRVQMEADRKSVCRERVCEYV